MIIHSHLTIPHIGLLNKTKWIINENLNFKKTHARTPDNLVISATI